MGLKAFINNVAGAITTDISVSQWKSKAAGGIKGAATSALISGGNPIAVARGAAIGVTKEVVKDELKK